ncbi:hypothetical protein [Candidatus Poriferisocius sp.]|uniref:hypothetical protein n=1 Tax=Candidatus Poriferisocius sp. TaxID=3101276 RepID=UPI003B012AAC
MHDVWPVYKGTSFNVWLPDTGIYYDSADAESMIAHLQEKRLSQRRTRSSAFAEQEGEIVNDPETLPCRHPRIAFRDVTRSTDTRTLIAALIPGDRVIIHKAPYLLQMEGSIADEAYLLGVLSSMPCDWQARRTIELVMSFGQFNQLSIPDPGKDHPVRDRVVQIAGRLAAVDDRFADWAAEVGVPVGSANEESIKRDLICELDACVALLYGLDEDDLAVVYETFSGTVDYSDRLAAVLAHFRRLTG